MKICCSRPNRGVVVKSTTFLFKNVLKNYGFCDSMKTVEMTKINNQK